VKRTTALADVPGENGRNVAAFDILQMLVFSAEQATRRHAPGMENEHLELKTQFIATEFLNTVHCNRIPFLRSISVWKKVPVSTAGSPLC
jgi:hypothetical protein